MMSHAYQYNKGKSYHSWWSSRQDTNSKTLVKGYSTLIPIKYNNSDLRNKGSHKTKKSHKKTLILPTIWRKWLKKRKKVLMENLHKPSMINLINNPQITTNAQWSKISYMNISPRFSSSSSFVIIFVFVFLFFCFFFVCIL